MEKYFNNYIVAFAVVLFFAVMGNCKDSEKNRMIAIYLFIYLFLFFNSGYNFEILGCGFAIAFLSFEVFTEDYEKIRLFNLCERIVDFLFRLLFQYSIIFFIMSILLLSIARGEFLNDFSHLSFFTGCSLIAFTLVIIHVSRSEFAIKSITEMVGRLRVYSLAGCGEDFF